MGLDRCLGIFGSRASVCQATKRKQRKAGEADETEVSGEAGR